MLRLCFLIQLTLFALSPVAAQNETAWPTSITEPTFVAITDSDLGFQRVFHPILVDSIATPCGLETLYIGAKIAGYNPILSQNGMFQLNLAPVILGVNGQSLPILEFYTSIFVTQEELQTLQPPLSRGDIEAAAFEFLMADLGYQYAAWTVRRDINDYYVGTPEADAVADIGLRRLRETQRITGLMPIRYSSGELPQGIPNDRLAALYNRTHVGSLMNLLFGQTGDMYFLPANQPLEESLVAVEDMLLEVPLVDNEFLPISGVDTQDIRELLPLWQSENRVIIFRVSKYRYQAPLSLEMGIPGNHYYVVIPDPRPTQLRQDSEPIVAIYDTINPQRILLTPVYTLPQLFTSVTVSAPL